MKAIALFILNRFILRTLWLGLLATFGIHLFLCLLPEKQSENANLGVQTETREVEKWNNEKYVKWVGNIFKGEPQISKQGTTSWEKREFRSNAFNTLILCGIAFLLSAVMGVFVGTTRAMINNELVSGPKKKFTTIWSFLSTGTLFILSSIPAYITAYFLFFILSSESNIYLAIIALALGSGSAMDVSRLTSNTHSQQLSAKYVENALSCGLRTGGLIPVPGYVAWHAFRNSLITIIPVTAYRLPLLVSSALLVEIVFDLSGLGNSLLTALVNQNIPMVLTIILISVLFVQVCVFIADIMAYVLHPQGTAS